ncbi:hypothetical protein L2755_05210 [Shewanella abyssi]|nr:hypothetical protein [Shewanella abyssi]MCL1049021.1 hypothetical protein [Shewanella abyssi]
MSFHSSKVGIFQGVCAFRKSLSFTHKVTDEVGAKVAIALLHIADAIAQQ